MSLIWNTKISSTFKYFSLITITAASISHIHYNILITVGPPLLLGSWYLYKWWFKHQYLTETRKIVPTSKADLDSDDNTIRIKKYDETDVSNVINGIDNEFDYFKRQLIEIIERRIIDYTIESQDKDNSIFSLFIDDNRQFSIKLNENDVETFIVLTASIPNLEDKELGPPEPRFEEFIKFSIPFYSSKDSSSRRRLGLIECYLLETEHNHEANYIQYKIAIEISPFKWLTLGQNKLLINSIGTKGIYESKMLLDDDKKPRQYKDDQEEITVNI